MKKNPSTQPTRGQFSILRQICNFIPVHLVAKLAREKGVEAKARTCTPWSHVVALLYAQLTHALSLNDVCDGLQLNRGALTAVRGAAAPCKNTFSHANKERDAGMAEALFWKVLGHLGALSPNFYGRKAVKLNKILFFADFMHYVRTGKPLTGAVDMRLPNGPAPKRLVPIREELKAAGEAMEKVVELPDELKQRRLVALRDPDPKTFSVAELRFLDSVIAQLRCHNAEQVSALSHSLPAWMVAEDKEEIPYEAAFVRPITSTPQDRLRATELAARHGW